MPADAVLVGRGSEDSLQTEVLLRVRGRRDGAARKFDPALGQTREEADASIARIRADLGAYGQYLHGHTPARHHRLWLDLIQALIAGRLTEEAVARGLLPLPELGRPRNKLLLLAPPASAKSSWVSIALPTWYLGNHPTHNVLFFTSSDPAANGFANTIKVILEQGKEHKEIFPEHPCRPHKARGWSTDGLFLHGTPMSGQSPAYRAVGFGASVMGQRANCLVGSTLIDTRDGPKRIEDLALRGWPVDVLSYSLERDRVEYRQARPHPKRVTERLVAVILSDLGVVYATPEHPFFVEGDMPLGYVAAEDLQVGDRLRARRGAEPHVVASTVFDVDPPVNVYNLEVDGNQNFYANGILTHNCLIIDDPMNQEDALSPNEQQKAKRYYDMTLARRLQPSEGVIVCVMTRWAEGDLASYFIEKAEAAKDWLTVALPMIADGPDDPLGREIGELLWPEQFPRPWVERERLGMPPAEWAAIYQCSAAQMAGDVFSDERWIKPLPRDFHTPGKDGVSLRDSLMIVQGVDVAFSEKDSACFTVILTLGIDRAKNAYILDVHRARMTVRQTEDAIVDRILAYEPTAVGLEDSAFRHAVTAQLVHNIRQRVMVNIRAVAPRGMTKGPSDKVARARLPASRAEAGLLYADRSAGWWPSFIGELLAFPRGKTSDQVDALSLAVYLGVTFQSQSRAPKRLVFNPH